MFLKKNNRIKILYKQFVKLRDNVHNRTKILKFKKKKWENLLQFYKKKLKWYKKFKAKDHFKYLITKYANKGTARKKQHRNSLTHSRVFRLFYGNTTKKLFKKQLKLIKTKKNKNFDLNYFHLLNYFETRLDTTLFRAKFSKSLRNSRQLITHGAIYVNNKKVTSSGYLLKESDIISVNKKYFITIENNLKYCLRKNLKLEIKTNTLWPLPPKNLLINYATLEIIFGSTDLLSFSHHFSFRLNLEKIINNYYHQ